jgi:hypothetical protein
VTILEVLFAIMVTTIGLLGALTLLPVAATQARKARTADASTSAVTAAVGFFDARGMRKPQNWIAYDLTSGTPRFPWAEFQAYQQNPLGPQPPLRKNWFGGFDSFCIDPRMTAANQVDPTNPALGVVVEPTATPNPTTGAATFPRRAIAGQPAMWRLGLSNGSATPMSKLLADSLFVFDDDLNYNRAADASVVAAQIIENLPAVANSPARRQVEGRLSWMATLVPKLDRYSMTLTDRYVLSIVVFHDRPANLVFNADPLNERVLAIPATTGMPGGGVTGGEVLLQTAAPVADQEAADEQLDVHTGEWIMLASLITHADIDPLSPGQTIGFMPVFKWYRIADIEAEVTWPVTVQGQANHGERFVTLVGQDWDQNTGSPHPSGATNYPTPVIAHAVVMEGVVAVVEKTIRLEP